MRRSMKRFRGRLTRRRFRRNRLRNEGSWRWKIRKGRFDLGRKVKAIRLGMSLIVLNVLLSSKFKLRPANDVVLTLLLKNKGRSS